MCEACIGAITEVLGAHFLLISSACFLSPASKRRELFWLAAYRPALLVLALLRVRKGSTGNHNRVGAFEALREELLYNAARFPGWNIKVGPECNSTGNQ